MGIDYVIDWECEPKHALSTAGILARLKARDRSAAIIRLYRDNGDQRAPKDMGFELVRRLPDGSEETQMVIVQTLIDEAAQLDPLAVRCEGCPANRAGRAFGCFGSVNYPISRTGELWLLKQLPGNDEPLAFLLLRQMLMEQRDIGQQAAKFRAESRAIFETKETFGKRIEGVVASTDQIFELLFLSQAITPTYGAALLIFFGAIPRDLEAETLQTLTPAPADYAGRFPFRLKAEPEDDETIDGLKKFLESVYRAWGLNVSLSLDT